LNNKNTQNAQALFNAIKDFRKWETRELSPIRFMIDTEWAWFDGKPYVGDL